MSFEIFSISKREKAKLCEKLLGTPEITPFSADPKFFALLATIGIHQEIGTIHDEFVKFLFDGRTGNRIPAAALRSEMIMYNGHSGVRIWAEGYDQLDPRIVGMRTLLHPELSFDATGSIKTCVFFPETIVKIAALGGAELVSVKPWALNTIFGGFDSQKTYYEGNMFEFVNIDALRYTRLLEKRQIVFWGTHDLVSHVAGIRKSAWPELEELGRTARQLFENYFQGVDRPVPHALVLPYTLGLLLDDLAQPMNYDSKNRKIVVAQLMTAIETRRTDPSSSAYLLKYPPSAGRLVELARSNNSIDTQEKSSQILEDLISEIHAFSLKRSI